MTTEGFKPSIGAPTDNQQTPLIKFRGVLKNYEVNTGVSTFAGREGQEFTRIVFNFTDIEVLESLEPYAFPIAVISLPYSERSETRWAALAKSFRNVLPQPDIDLLVGKKQEWHFTKGNNTRQQVDETAADGTTARVWKSLPTDAWQLTWIEGAGSVNGANLMDSIVVAADGKSNEQFYQWLYGDPTVKQMAGYNDAVTAASNRELLETLQTGGKLSRDAEGIWHKVA